MERGHALPAEPLPYSLHPSAPLAIARPVAMIAQRVYMPCERGNGGRR
jgi:hypothetical protein